MTTENGSHIESLKVVLGKTFRLYVQTHGYHWNVQGPQFLKLHELFEEQYANMWEALDEVAERLRALGVSAPGTVTELMSLAGEPEEEKAQSADDMVAKLIQAHSALAECLRGAFKDAEDAVDDVTAGMLTDRLTWHEKTLWMLRSGSV
ncbi:DNA starvation/stationary phase protection protein [uncultured Tateyamaria sp.]|uniref:Dps family protein n=1 Tax=uncultured Tateyamaria sp. TaxID=455651 RepID=UPI00262C9EE7|nr:DNA starvation/stationary phase protection protein [uncultured Tateyamaria sp.]